MTEKKLYLLQFAAVHTAELCAGSPKIVRREVVELKDAVHSSGLRTRRRFRICRYPRRIRDT